MPHARLEHVVFGLAVEVGVQCGLRGGNVVGMQRIRPGLELDGRQFGQGIADHLRPALVDLHVACLHPPVPKPGPRALNGVIELFARFLQPCFGRQLVLIVSTGPACPREELDDRLELPHDIGRERHGTSQGQHTDVLQPEGVVPDPAGLYDVRRELGFCRESRGDGGASELPSGVARDVARHTGNGVQVAVLGVEQRGHRAAQLARIHRQSITQHGVPVETRADRERQFEQDDGIERGARGHCGCRGVKHPAARPPRSCCRTPGIRARCWRSRRASARRSGASPYRRLRSRGQTRPAGTARVIRSR
jgi:hypothetical protein